MARIKGPRKVQQGGAAGSSFLDEQAVHMPVADTFVATTAENLIRCRSNARPSTTNTLWHEHYQIECQQNRVNIPRCPRIRSGRSLCSLGSPLNAGSFGPTRK